MKKSLIINRVNLIIILVLAVVSMFIATEVVNQNQQSTFSTRSSAETFNETNLIFENIGLNGVGNSGDSTSPADNSKSNKNPHLMRKVTVNIYDTSDKLIHTVSDILKYDYNQNTFKATIPLENSLNLNGAYIVKIKVESYLQKRIPDTVQITKGTDTIIPSVTLVAGDINGNNVLDITDLNILLGCYSDIVPAKFCDSGRENFTDLSNDGQVNQLDYNLFLRELLAVQKGD